MICFKKLVDGFLKRKSLSDLRFSCCRSFGKPMYAYFIMTMMYEKLFLFHQQSLTDFGLQVSESEICRVFLNEGDWDKQKVKNSWVNCVCSDKAGMYVVGYFTLSINIFFNLNSSLSVPKLMLFIFCSITETSLKYRTDGRFDLISPP